MDKRGTAKTKGNESNIDNFKKAEPFRDCSVTFCKLASGISSFFCLTQTSQEKDTDLQVICHTSLQALISFYPSLDTKVELFFTDRKYS